MGKFLAKDGQFWMDDSPILIQAGEFHYFRTPADQWPHRLGLLKKAGFNTLASYIPWIWHQLEEDVSDFDGHSHPMRNLVGFLDLAAEMGFYIIVRPGPYIMAETINEGIPPWVFDKYPQATFISQDQKAQNIVSYLHPDFLACTAKWYQAIFCVLAPRQITRGGKIIMVQLDNEMGMVQWVRNIFDTNPDTITRFAAYLHTVYGENLSCRYPIHLSESNLFEEFLRDGILNPTEVYAANIVEDYRHFYRGYLREYASFLWAEAKADGMEVLPVINIHGFANGGKTFPIGISQLIEVMRLDGMVSATDVYPLHIGEGNFHQLLMVNEITKALHYKEQALFSIEFQAGGVDDFSNGQISLFDLHTRLCVSSGMRAINHYLFCDGENDPILSPVKRHDWGHAVRKNGTLRKHYFRYPQLSQVFKAYDTALVLSKLETVATLGVLLDYFMTEVNNAYTMESTNILTHQRETILCDMVARGLALTHRPFDAVELGSCNLDVGQTPLCWVMMEKQCNAAIQQKLVNYIRLGGNLILAGRICVEDFNHVSCTILKDAIGIQSIQSDPPFVPSFIHAFSFHDIPVSFVESYNGQFDEVFARRETGEVVGFIQHLGKGKVMVLGAAMPVHKLDELDIFRQMALKMDCQPLFELSDWADVRLSRGESGSFLFLNNYLDDPVETTVEYRNQVLFGGCSIHLPARRGLILPIEWRLNDDVLIHFVTTEIVDVCSDGMGLMLKAAQNEFVVELSASGYYCDKAEVVEATMPRQRLRFHGTDGILQLRRIE